MRKKKAGKCRKRMKTEIIRLKYINMGYTRTAGVPVKRDQDWNTSYTSLIFSSQETQADVVKYPGYICYTNPVNHTHHE